MMGRDLARRILVAFAGLAAIEWIVSGWSYRTRIDDDDWERVREVVDAIPEHEPVFLATTWLGPRARMQVPRLRDWDAAAAPDLRGFPSFHVLGLGDDWSSALAHDLEDLTAPVYTGDDDAGALTIHHFELPGASRPLASLVDAAGSLRVRTAAACNGGPERWKCKEGTVWLRAVEIDYRARRCFAVDVKDDTAVRIEAAGLPTGDVLRGHVGFDDFNRRLRSDAPVDVAIRIDDAVVARWTVTDAQGWWPFAVATSAGTHDVSIEIRTPVRGTWQRRGYTRELPHVPCVELRTFMEGGA